MIIEFASCLAITVICCAAGFVIKKTRLIKDKWIPLILFVSGIVLGVVAYLIKMPGYPAEDIVTAIAVGVYSSMMSVGVHQVFKQIGKDE